MTAGQVLVTGASGLVGRYTRPALLARGLDRWKPGSLLWCCALYILARLTPA